MSFFFVMICIWFFDFIFVYMVSPVLTKHLGFPDGTSGKELACQRRRHKRHRFTPWVGKIPLEEEMTTHSSILAWRISWTGSLEGYSPEGHKKFNMEGSSLVHVPSAGPVFLGLQNPHPTFLIYMVGNSVLAIVWLPHKLVSALQESMSQ